MMKGCYAAMFSDPERIAGKWNGRVYRVKKELGRGANGVVYLVNHQGQSLALKVGRDTFSLTSEVNVLKHFQKAQGQVLGPSLYDVDDWASREGLRPFYVMNVIEGDPLLCFIKDRGEEWLPVLVVQLLGFLDQLHQQGWVFGDLKPEHLLVTGHPPRLAWFDAGGVTRIGRAIKEYTELYDRGSWGMGDRKAEPGYDLFSVALIVMHCVRGKPLVPGPHPVHTLEQALQETEHLLPYQGIVRRALSGRYSSAREMRQDWLMAWRKLHQGRLKTKQKGRAGRKRSTLAGASSAVKQQRGKKRSFLKRLGKVISFLCVSSFLIFLFALYLFYQAL